MTRAPSRQVEHEHLGIPVAEDGQHLLRADRRPVALTQGGAVHGSGPASDVDPRPATGPQPELPALARRDARNEQVRVCPFDGYWKDIGRQDDYIEAIDDFERDSVRFLRR